MVARNLCFTRLKKERRLSPLEETPEKGALFDTKADVLEQLIRDERIRILYQALSKLTNQRREILIMQYFGGLTQREIAAVLNLTPENVRIITYRAKRELKSYMEENGYEIS